MSAQALVAAFLITISAGINLDTLSEEFHALLGDLKEIAVQVDKRHADALEILRP